MGGYQCVEEKAVMCVRCLAGIPVDVRARVIYS